MAIQQITLDTTNSINTQIITLENVRYKLRFFWNYRENRWYMDIYTSDDVIILGGLKLTTNYELLRHYIIDGLPPGAMILENADNVDYKNKDDINNAWLLLYITSDDELFTNA